MEARLLSSFWTRETELQLLGEQSAQYRLGIHLRQSCGAQMLTAWAEAVAWNHFLARSLWCNSCQKAARSMAMQESETCTHLSSLSGFRFFVHLARDDKYCLVQLTTAAREETRRLLQVRRLKVRLVLLCAASDVSMRRQMIFADAPAERRVF